MLMLYLCAVVVVASILMLEVFVGNIKNNKNELCFYLFVVYCYMRLYCNVNLFFFTER